MVRSTGGRGGSKTEPREAGRFTRKLHPEGELAKAVYGLLTFCEGLLEEGPDPRRVGLRTFKGALRAVFPHEFRVNDSELSQELAELDGEDVDA